MFLGKGNCTWAVVLLPLWFQYVWKHKVTVRSWQTAPLGLQEQTPKQNPFQGLTCKKCSLGAWCSKIFILQDPGQQWEELHMGGRAERQALKPNVWEDASHSESLYSKTVPECTCYCGLNAGFTQHSQKPITAIQVGRAFTTTSPEKQSRQECLAS